MNDNDARPDGGERRGSGAQRVPGVSGPMTKPNVLLISINALGTDALPSYGHAQNSTPHFDRLAALGHLAASQARISRIPCTLERTTR